MLDQLLRAMHNAAIVVCGLQAHFDEIKRVARESLQCEVSNEREACLGMSARKLTCAIPPTVPATRSRVVREAAESWGA